MYKLPDYLKDRSIENNLYATMGSWNAELKLGGGNCSACCFRNWRKKCEKMPCFDKEHGINIHWDTLHMPQKEAVTLLNHFKDRGGNTKELAAVKRKELFDFLEAGNTLEDWENKKYTDAWKGMGR